MDIKKIIKESIAKVLTEVKQPTDATIKPHMSQYSVSDDPYDVAVELGKKHGWNQKQIEKAEKLIRKKYIKESVNEADSTNSISKKRAGAGLKQKLKGKRSDGMGKYTATIYGLDSKGKRVELKSLNDLNKYSKFEIDESVNEAKVNYDFSEQELIRVLRQLKRGASTEVKMIKAFEKTLGRKITKAELWESNITEAQGKLSDKDLKIISKLVKDPNAKLSSIEKSILKKLIGESVNEASLSKVYNAAKKGSYPITLVAIEKGKVVDQKLVGTPEIVPAAFNDMQKEFPKAQVNVEDRKGKILFKEVKLTEAFSRMPSNTIKNELYSAKKTLNDYCDWLEAGNDSGRGKTLDNIINLLKKCKKDIKRFKNPEEVKGTVYESINEASDVFKIFDEKQKLYGQAMDIETDMKTIAMDLKQTNIDMEQEAEPEGGKVADRYGKEIDKLEKTYKKKKADLKKIFAKLDKLEMY